MASSDSDKSVEARSQSVIQKRKSEPEKWESDLVGNFLLQLYHRNILVMKNNENEFKAIQKSTLIKEFEENYVNDEILEKLKTSIGIDKIDLLLLLARNNYLHSKKCDDFYRISCVHVMAYHKNKLNELDMANICCSGTHVLNLKVEMKESKIDKADLLANSEVDDASPTYQVDYQGTVKRPNDLNFILTNTSCYICQINFNNIKDYDDHVITHNAGMSSEYFTRMEPLFSLSYKVYQDSSKMRFTIRRTGKNNSLCQTTILNLDKVVFVYSNKIVFMNILQPDNLKDTAAINGEKAEDNVYGIFYLDSYLITTNTDYAIIVVAHSNGECDNERTIRLIEQHNLLHRDSLPTTKFAYRPTRLPKTVTFKSTQKLPSYKPPKYIVDAVLRDNYFYDDLGKVSKGFQNYLNNNMMLTPSNYVESMEVLLQIEDAYIINEYTKLDQHNVVIYSSGDEYSAQMSVQGGLISDIITPCDYMYIQPENEQCVKTKRCSIVNVHKNRIVFKSQSGIISVRNNNGKTISYKCKFYPSRFVMMYQYRALHLLTKSMSILSKFLFPTNVTPQPPVKSSSLKLFNNNIHTNPEQMEAVSNIAYGPRNEAPYIIYGPPGTGKTTVIVEAILQLITLNSKSRILVTAQSNTACDEVALRLCKYLKTMNIKRDIARIYAKINEERASNLDDALLECSNLYSVYFLPCISVLDEYRIVIITLSMIGKLSTSKFSNVGFTHVFIDEAAACTETEALLGIVGTLKPDTNLIISGDHKQLGPILKCSHAKRLGFDVSLMERLLKQPCYHVDKDTGNYDRSIQTRLRLNLRSHPKIVDMFSRLFYDNLLEGRANSEYHDLINKWYKFPKTTYPIIFHSIKGTCRRDKYSSSLYNRMELNVLMGYLKELMYFGINGMVIKQTDIGIISPYKQQLQYIQKELELRKWFHIEVGSVEKFQGQEKLIILVSLVRSNTRTIGFLDNPRRLNVVISRAKSILILIGNADTLNEYQYYCDIIEMCRKHKTLYDNFDATKSNQL